MLVTAYNYLPRKLTESTKLYLCLESSKSTTNKYAFHLDTYRPPDDRIGGEGMPFEGVLPSGGRGACL